MWLVLPVLGTGWVLLAVPLGGPPQLCGGVPSWWSGGLLDGGLMMMAGSAETGSFLRTGICRERRTGACLAWRAAAEPSVLVGSILTFLAKSPGLRMAGLEALMLGLITFRPDIAAGQGFRSLHHNHHHHRCELVHPSGAADPDPERQKTTAVNAGTAEALGGITSRGGGGWETKRARRTFASTTLRRLPTGDCGRRRWKLANSPHRPARNARHLVQSTPERLGTKQQRYGLAKEKAPTIGYVHWSIWNNDVIDDQWVRIGLAPVLLSSRVDNYLVPIAVC